MTGETTDVVRRRGGRLFAAIAALLALGVLALVLVLGPCRARGTSSIDATSTDGDANIDALVVVALDGGPIDAPTVDANDDELDAGRAKRRDAGSAIDAAARPVDAAVRPVDAAVAAAVDAAAPTGTGFLTCTADPYAHVSVDGVDFGSTPFFKKKIAAGRHEVVFTSPVGGVVTRQVVDIKPGQTVTVSAP